MRKKRKNKRIWRCGAPWLGGEALEARHALSAAPFPTESLFVVSDPPNPFLTGSQFEAANEGQSGKGTLTFSPDRLVVGFNRVADTTSGAAGAHSILNPDNWRLTREGIDVSSLITSIEASQGNYYFATVHVSAPLGPGHYQLVARDTIRDGEGGRALDGDKDRTPGGDAVNAFNVSGIVSQDVVTQVGTGTGAGSVISTAADAAGNYVVVWHRAPIRDWLGNILASDNLPKGIVAQRYNGAGEKLGGLIAVSAVSTAWGAKVAMNAEGAFVVTWNEVSASDYVSSVYAQRFDAGGTPATAKLRVATSYESVTHGNVTRHDFETADTGIDAAGNFVVVWAHQAAYDSYVNVARFSPTGMLLGKTELVRGYNPRLAVNGAGQFAITWVDELEIPALLGPWRHAYLQTFRANGGTASGVVQVDTGGSQLMADVSMDAAGNTVVVWTNKSDNLERIQGRRYSSAGVPLSSVLAVDDGAATLALGNLSLSADSAGNFAVGWSVWVRPTSPANVVEPNRLMLARMFDASGLPLDDAFAVQQYAEKWVSPSVALSDSGDLIATWGESVFSSRAIPPTATEQLSTTSAYLNYGVSSEVHTIHPAANDYFVKTQQFAPRLDLKVDLNGDAPTTGFMANYRPDGGPVRIVDPELLIRALGTQLTSATVSIESFQAGDLLTVNTAGTNLTANYVNGVLTLTGDGTKADYERALSTIDFSSTAGRGPGSNVYVKFVVGDGTHTSPEAESIVSVYQPGLSTIVGRHVFYNNSAYDGNDPATGASDDGAIATDKFALRVGQAAMFANYTSYDRGINGIMIDLAGDHGTLSANDFQFRVGNNDNSSSWSYAPPPLSIVVRADAGVSGSDRVEIIWADFAILNTWLEVAVAANGNTGLAQSDTFYFGNAVGETGNMADNAEVNARDFLRTLNHLLINPNAAVDIASPYDFDRDGLITSQDFLVNIHQVLTLRTTLKLIAPPSSSVSTGWGLFSSVTLYVSPPPTLIGVAIAAMPMLTLQAAPVALAELSHPVGQSSPTIFDDAVPSAAKSDGSDSFEDDDEDWLDALFCC